MSSRDQAPPRPLPTSTAADTDDATGPPREVVAAPTRARGARVPERARYRVGLSPAEVLSRIAKAPEVSAYRPGRFPDLGDPVPATRYVAEVGESSLRIARAHRDAEATALVRGFGEGGGVLRTLELRGELRELQGATEVDLELVRGRSARSFHRFAGFMVLLVAGLSWVAFGSGAMGQRAIVLGIAALFLSPALVLDAARALRERRERLDLLALMERILGPVALDDVEHSPYRNPRRPAGLGSPEIPTD